MATIKSFQAKIRRRAKILPELAGRGVDSIAVAVVGALVSGTPVDTGLARSNWLVRRGSPSRKVRTPRSSAATVEEAIRALKGRVTREGENVVISNGGKKVPYLGRLNNGWSLQAPAGFFRAAITVGLNLARTRIRVLSSSGKSLPGFTVERS